MWHGVRWFGPVISSLVLPAWSVAVQSLPVWSGLVGPGLAWSGLVLDGSVVPTIQWDCLIWSRLARSGLFWSGLVWRDLMQCGLDHSGHKSGSVWSSHAQSGLIWCVLLWYCMGVSGLSWSSLFCLVQGSLVLYDTYQFLSALSGALQSLQVWSICSGLA